MVVFLGPPACNGTPAVMNGRSGDLGVVGSHYRNDLYCQWQITVETGKVSFVFTDAAFIPVDMYMYLVSVRKYLC